MLFVDGDHLKFTVPCWPRSQIGRRFPDVPSGTNVSAVLPQQTVCIALFAELMPFS